VATRAVDDGVNALEIDAPSAPGLVVGVRDVVAYAAPLAADVANPGHAGTSFSPSLFELGSTTEQP